MSVPRIVGRRVVLRPLRRGDLDDLVRLAGHASVARWTFAPHPYTRAHGRAALRAGGKGRVRFAIATRRGDALVGVIGVHAIDREHATAELGYWVGAPHRGRGYATEAVRLACAWAERRHRLARISAGTFPGNAASERVLRRNGFRLEGTMRKARMHRGTRRDVRLWARVR